MKDYFMFIQVVLRGAVISVLLTGCGGGGSNNEDDRELPALQFLTTPSTDVQTILPSEFELGIDDSVALDKMTYRDQSGNTSIEFKVIFQDCELCSPPVMPKVTRVFDINTKYIMFNMSDSTVAWHGKNYHGNYPMIMDKSSGKLYPIIVDDKPSEFDHSFNSQSTFLSQQNQGDIAIDNVLYSFRVSDKYHQDHGIFKAEVQEGAFVVETLKSDIFPDDRDVQVDNLGNMLVVYSVQLEESSTHHYGYISASGTFTELDYSDTRSRYSSFRVIDGKLAGIDRDDPMYFSFVELGNGKLVSSRSQYEVNDFEANRVTSSKRSSEIDRYSMNASCIVNRLEEDGYFYVGKSNIINADRPYDTFDALRASQHTLFCVDYIESWYMPEVTVKVSAFDTVSATFYEFDTGIKLYDDYHNPVSNDWLIAEGGVLVQSNEAIMLYMNKFKSHEVAEFYINPFEKTLEKRVHDGFISPIGFTILMKGD